jgi:hypothetical protein
MTKTQCDKCKKETDNYIRYEGAELCKDCEKEFRDRLSKIRIETDKKEKELQKEFGL